MNPEAPLLVVFAGPNGAGKSTLRDHLFRDSPLPFINADRIAQRQDLGPYEAALVAESQRDTLRSQGLSFSFETVLSDPVGAKVDFLKQCRAEGYFLSVHFIGLATAEFSRARVVQRVLEEGGHDVPDEKLFARYPRVLSNLSRLIGEVDELTIYDNSSSEEPYRILARLEGQDLLELSEQLPNWIHFLNLPSLSNPHTKLLP